MAAYTEKVKKTVAERIMRLLFVTVVVLAPCLVRAQNITINVTDRPLSEVFQAIKKASGYQVFYVNQNVDDSRKVSFNVSGVELRAALDKLCASVALSYNIVDRTIVISPPRQKTAPASDRRPAGFVITGTVFDENKNPVAYASVVQKDAGHNGASTDEKGCFRLTLPSGRVSVVVSCVGMKKQTIEVNNQSSFDIYLEPEVNDIAATVVTGYMPKAKNSFTGTAVLVKGDELRTVNNNSFFDALKVFDPSFQVVDVRGMFGSDPNYIPEQIEIRGQNSFPEISGSTLKTMTSLPIFILDGFEVKVLLALLALLLLPWGELSSWSSETPVASYTAASSTASSGSAQWDTGAVALYSYSGDVVQSQAETHVYGTGEGPDVLFDFLQALGTRPAAAVLAFLALYLLVFNDLRYNRQAWRHGVLGMLAARELELPVQKRLSRSAGLVSLSCLLLNCVTAGLLIWCSSWSWGSVRLETAWLLCLPPLLLAAVTVAFLFRQRRLWGDLGALTGQIAAVRAGELARPLELPRDHDLSQAADDLNHIQQGLQAAMEERTRSERMKVELVTNVSHDLKTPLTSIISYAELLEQEHLEPPAGEYVTILSQKAQRLKGMVQDVFEVSKAASGQLPVSLKRLDLARLLRQTLAHMDQPIQESGLQLRTQLPDHSVLIQGDSDRLYRVFQNLLGNALKYSLAGSRVYLTLTVEEGQAVAALRNTSAAELRPGLDYTQRFVRGDESRTDGGSGLGLSIASSFVQACGGQFQVETQADLFTALVSFPLDASPSDPR